MRSKCPALVGRFSVQVVLALLLGSPLSAETVENDAQEELADEFVERIEMEVEESEQLYEELILPTGKVVFRSRFLHSGNYNPSTHYNYLKVSGGNAVFTLLETDRLSWERLEQFRASLRIRQPGYTLVLGHFKVNAGQGWTVSSSPARFLHSSRSHSYTATDEIAGFTSSEAYRGWLGGAAQLRSTRQPFYPEVAFWAGVQNFDGRRVGDSDQVYLYSSFIDSDTREIRVHEIHQGISMKQRLNLHGTSLQLIRTSSGFSEQLSPNTSARFRFTEHSQQLGSTGLLVSHESDRFSVEAEGARQDQEGYGGSVSASYRRQSIGKFYGSAWRATRRFATLHARPELVFGFDPAGTAGYGLSWANQPAKRWRFILSHAYRQRETERYLLVGTSGTDPSPNPVNAAEWSRATWVSFAFLLPAELELNANVTLSDSKRFQSALQTFSTPQRHSLRLELRHRAEHHLLAIRSQHVVSNSGQGRLFSLDWRANRARPVGYGTSITYLDTDSWAERVTLVEPVGPGQFPLLTLGGNRIRLAGVITSSPLFGLSFWASSSIDVVLQETEILESTNSRAMIRWGLGAEWHPTL